MRKSISHCHNNKKAPRSRQPLNHNSGRSSIWATSPKQTATPTFPGMDHKKAGAAQNFKNKKLKHKMNKNFNPLTLKSTLSEKGYYQVHFDLQTTTAEEILIEYLKITLARIIDSQGIQDLEESAMITGGWLRDKILGFRPKDIDLVVLPSLLHPLVSHLLAGTGRVIAPGIKHLWNRVFYLVVKGQGPQKTYKFCFRVGQTIINLDVSTLCMGSIFEDAKTRDFTLNAFYYDLHNGLILDPLKANNDLNLKILKGCGDPELLIRDFPRVIRLARFLAMTDLRLVKSLRVPLSKLERSSMDIWKPTKQEFQRISSDNQGGLEKVIEILVHLDLLYYFPFSMHLMGQEEVKSFDRRVYTRRLLQMARKLDGEEMRGYFADELAYWSKEPPFGSFRGQVVKVFWLFIYLSSFKDFENRELTSSRIERCLAKIGHESHWRRNLEDLVALAQQQPAGTNCLIRKTSVNLHQNFWMLMKNDEFLASSKLVKNIKAESSKLETSSSPSESQIIAEKEEALLVFKTIGDEIYDVRGDKMVRLEKANNNLINISQSSNSSKSSQGLPFSDLLNEFSIGGACPVDIPKETFAESKQGLLPTEQALISSDQVQDESVLLGVSKSHQIILDQLKASEPLGLIGGGRLEGVLSQNQGEKKLLEDSTPSNLPDTKSVLEGQKHASGESEPLPTPPSKIAGQVTFESNDPNKVEKAFEEGSGSTNDRGSSASQSYLIQSSYPLRDRSERIDVKRDLFHEFEECLQEEEGELPSPRSQRKAAGKKNEIERSPKRVSGPKNRSLVQMEEVNSHKQQNLVRFPGYISFRSFADFVRFIIRFLMLNLLIIIFVTLVNRAL